MAEDNEIELNNIFLDLREQFGEKRVKMYYDFIQVVIGSVNGLWITVDVKGAIDIIISDDENTDYTCQVADIIVEIKKECTDDRQISSNEVPRRVIQQFIQDITDSAGFTYSSASAIEPGFTGDSYWKSMVSKAATDRDITIFTFGNKYKQFTYWVSKVEKAYSALVVNSQIPQTCNLHKIRGTDDIMKKAVRCGTGFEYFISCLIESVEKNNFKIIGIYCRAGHHHSVACAELLKEHVYKNAKITHLTIND